MKLNVIITTALVFAFATVGQCEPQITKVDKKITEWLGSNPNFSTLSTLINATGLTEPLSEGEFTLFAPSNEAFENLPARMKSTVQGLLTENFTVSAPNATQLLTMYMITALLTYHAHNGTDVTLQNFTDPPTSISTLLSHGPITMNLALQKKEEDYLVNDAQVKSAYGMVDGNVFELDK